MLEEKRKYQHSVLNVSSVKPATPKQKRPREYRKHGLTILKRAVNSLGNRVIDKRTITGKALAKWREDLVRDLGGDLSTQEDTVVDVCVKSKLILDSIDVWLLTQDSLINKRKRSVIPAVRDRKDLAKDLVDHLKALGLKRRQKEVDGWKAIAEKYGTKEDQESE